VLTRNYFAIVAFYVPYDHMKYKQEPHSLPGSVPRGPSPACQSQSGPRASPQTRCAGPPTAFRPAPPATAHAPAHVWALAPPWQAWQRCTRGAPARRRLVPRRQLAAAAGTSLRAPRAAGRHRAYRTTATSIWLKICGCIIKEHAAMLRSRRRAPDLRDVQRGVRRLLRLQVVLHSHLLALLDLHPEELHVWVHHRHRARDTPSVAGKYAGQALNERICSGCTVCELRFFEGRWVSSRVAVARAWRPVGDLLQAPSATRSNPLTQL